MKLFIVGLFLISVSACTNTSQTKTENAGKKGASLTHRTNQGLVALYQFKEGKGDHIADLSGIEPLAPLKISNNEKGEISWLPNGGISTIPGEYRTDKSAMQGMISSIEPAVKINKLIKETGRFTVEIWAEPANVEQMGPVRLVSLSENTQSRNLTIGHAAHAYDFRLRTSKTSSNGLPSLRTKDSYKAKAEPTHIVFTFLGNEGITYINGEKVDWFFYEGTPPGENLIGDLSVWDDNYQLILGNEIGGERAWKGNFYLVAFYNRVLNKKEIDENLQAGY